MIDELTDASLIEYIEKRIPEEEVRKIEQHLVDCNACRERHKQISMIVKGIDEMLESSDENGIPFAMDVKILSDIKVNIERKKNRFKNILTTSAAAAILVAFALLALQLLKSNQEKGKFPVLDNTKVVKSQPFDGTAAESGIRAVGKIQTVKGDVNHDGKVDIIDAQLLQKMLFSTESVDVSLCDFTGDGLVDIRDVQDIVKSVLKDSK